eukprot:TRINITY_DN9354_c0_g1_i1.p2 TRINITY_DN9354_c0_g1~~TRINITY_DN9354_c0_g1_i1.p2  ORF type:complete len:386 (+),score=160.77 TRINITY_DN9354_c0_g1_i1:88-1158(+)
MSSEGIQTEVTRMLRIRHPVLLAGMFGVAHHDLAAAVSNAGGLGTIGGLTMKPNVLQKEIDMLKEKLDDKTAFGVDLAWPQVGGNARKTNYDYTGGHFPELIDIIVREKARLFVCAIGVPPKWAVDKLHAGGVICMNMIGEPKHVEKALSVGMDLICAQGTEAGGHSGDIATLPLIPQCVDRCRGRVGGAGHPVHVVAAGGIYDGRGLAAALSLGAQAVWVGTRFVASTESVGSKVHKSSLIKAESTDTVRTLIYSGRPVRCYRSEYVQDWEQNRSQEIKELCDKGVVPIKADQKHYNKKVLPSGQKLTLVSAYPQLFGQACGGIKEILPARQIVHNMVSEAVGVLKGNALFVAKL